MWLFTFSRCQTNVMNLLYNSKKLMFFAMFQKLMFFPNKIQFCLYTSLTVSRINAVWYTKQVQDMF